MSDLPPNASDEDRVTGPIDIPPEFRQRSSSSVELPGAIMPPPAPTRGRDGKSLVVAILFGVAFGWDLFEALANLVGLLNYATAAGYRLNSFAWIVLGTAIVLPPLGYAIALGIGRRRGPARLALVLFAALAATSCCALTLEALVR